MNTAIGIIVAVVFVAASGVFLFSLFKLLDLSIEIAVARAREEREKSE